ncbi:MAG: hypothetical protein IJY14_03580 [Acholeplasmatales bacterium]|nr:hypothetical protein [Acholeplasmatales bacterium]
MFSIGDTILYTTSGICRVDSLIEKEFNGSLVSYYVLKPLFDSKTTLTVPVDNPITNTKLHQLLSKDDILALLQEYPSIEPYWIENENERKKHFSNILRTGNRKDTITMLKSIKNHQIGLKDRGRKLHACDEQTLKDATKLIADEFSIVLNMEKSYIVEMLNEPIKQ